MALTLPGSHDEGYYTGSSYGQYQFLTLEDIVETFIATYVGVGKICENIRTNDIYFHATRALQEFSYDVFRSIKAQEITVPNTLLMKLPRDFVNHVKLSWSDNSGVEHVLYPAIKTSNPTNVGQDVNDAYTFTGNALDTDSSNVSTTWENYKSAKPNENQQDDYNDEDYVNVADGRFGIAPQHAQINGSYFIDYQIGNIHFASSISGKTVILEYISDGMNAADNDGISSGTAIVHKFAEEAMYKHILYGCLSALKEPPPMISEIKKERWAETRKAKLRLSNIKIEELTQILRGGSKWIKH